MSRSGASLPFIGNRFRKTWSRSSEQSLSPHVGNRTVPRRLFVRSSKGGNGLSIGGAALVLAALVLFFLSQRGSSLMIAVHAYLPPPPQTAFRAWGFGAGPIVVSRDG